uniref:PiggyBac transposable element-derived protein 3-like n=1 Tax=Diabrotica virgifera virgifera TaxID=50390 RepID=A0A6P7H3T1_DIAVI
MIPFLGRCELKQYVKNKPRPVGLKNFVMTTSTGIVTDFEIYQGNTSAFAKFKNCGLGSSVILHFANTLPKGSHIFFDRYFNSVTLMEELNKIGVYGTGTVMTNRLQAPAVFKNDKEMPRGESEKFTRCDSLMCLVKWKDNKGVLMLPNALSVEPEAIVKRWCKSAKCFVEVSCPNIVKTGGLRPKRSNNTEGAGSEDGENEDRLGNPQKKQKRFPVKLPEQDKRYDGYEHWPLNDDLQNPLCCRLEACQSRSRIRCSKCNVYLCLSKNKNCFKAFHTR